MAYPTKIEANGRIYNINTDYRYALESFKVINNPDISDLERFYAVLAIMIKENVIKADEGLIMEKLGIFLRCGEDTNPSEDEIDMDYEQDQDIIKTSIRQCYHTNINKEDMHWWEYNELISGLTEETLLARTRELRTFDVNEIEDVKKREAVIKAKEKVALKKRTPKYNDKEEENINNFYKLIGKDRKDVKK